MLNQDDFFNKYCIHKGDFDSSGLNWNTLKQIYNDYSSRYKDFENCLLETEKFIADGMEARRHSICGRVKNPEHLIEKIIRKRVREQNKKYRDINVSNYLDIVRDLIGIRILVLSKEDWEGIFDRLTSVFPDEEKSKLSSSPAFMKEPPIAYTRYGDRDIFKNKIHMEHTNKGYRSQHYVVKYKEYYCEIQVRTLAEEVYGEFDHFVKYPYRDNNNFLRRYTSSVSQLLDSVDELISTCFQLDESGWQQCGTYFDTDIYTDWQHIEQKVQRTKPTLADYDVEGDDINIGSYANAILFGRTYNGDEK